MSLVNWVIGKFEGVIEAEFVLTDLVEVKRSEAEIFRDASFDTMTTDTVAQDVKKNDKDRDYSPKHPRLKMY